ncbi:MAG: alkaline phosphatase D, partial [Myxococcota bacterium]
MKRREFLRGTLVTAGALAVGPVGCGSDDETLDPARTLTEGSAFFPQSVASGDPRESSVVLWTRLLDPTASDLNLDLDLALELEVSLDEAFAELIVLSDSARSLTAKSAADGCVKVHLADLQPGTHYYYRFVYASSDGSFYTSRTGRTKTAPARDADTKVRFAFVSCQDANGHFFNTYARLLELDEIDFFVHLGDYIYETTGNPSFQDSHPDRRMEFSKPDEAISFDEGGYFAAKSLGNYRELYQFYRGDRQLQRMHERYPIIAIWDDHEFSDDCHGITATYHAGEQDEADEARRKSATQAWFEYMPVDYRAGSDFDYDPAVAFPDDIEIWRDFEFGKHVHLVMTDLRTRRVDHIIDEAAFPGSVLATQADLTEHLGEIPDLAREYVDIDSFEGGKYKTLLDDLAEANGFTADDVAGLMSVPFINGLVEGDPIATDPARERGLAVHMMGKRSKYSSLGSRYLVVKDAYDAWTKVRWSQSGGESEQMMGPEQRQWFLDTMKGSDRTWKLWGSEFLLTQLIADLTQITSLGEGFAQRFYVACEDWTNQPNRRDALIEELSPLSNVVALIGDIHAFFASTPTSRNDGTSAVVELCTAGIASNSFRTLLLRTAQGDPTLPPTAAALAAGAKSLLTDKYTKPNGDLAFAEPEVQGFAIVEVDGQKLSCEFHGIQEEHVGTDLGD